MEAETEPEVAELNTATLALNDEQRQLVEDNIGLAHYWANKFSKTIPETEYSDVAQQALVGLAKAARSWDRKPPEEKEKYPFSSYATNAIKNHLKTAYRKQTKYASHELKTLDEPIEYGGEEDSSTDVGKHMVPEPKDYSIGGSKSMIDKESEDLLSSELEKLREPDRSIIKGWMNGESYRDMADVYKVSAMQIGNYAKRGLEKLRWALKEKGVKTPEEIMPEGVERSGRAVKLVLIEAIVNKANTCLYTNGLVDRMLSTI